MQATLNATALKPFIRALTCLSRYGDDLVIYADSEHFTLSATNSSLSAYCRFRYGKMFFSRYRIGGGTNGASSSTANTDEVEDVKGQLLAKTLLSIFKHRTLEKTVERCELVIVDGSAHEEPDEDEDTLESRLIVRLHCKHGIVKTHRLPLLVPTSLLSPGVPDSTNESRLTVGPRVIKDITEHFSNGRGIKTDPQLVWTFGDTDVEVKSLESSIDTKGRSQLATELTISADEFDVYEIAGAPITIAFHLREFNATIAFAESMGSALELRFTDPAAPLFIDIEGDECHCLFVISTSEIQGQSSNANYAITRNSSTPNAQRSGAQKRPHPDAEAQSSNASPSVRGGSEAPRVEKVKKSMRAVQRTEAPGAAAVSRESSMALRDDIDEHAMPPPSLIPNRTQRSQPRAFQASQYGDFGDPGNFDTTGVEYGRGMENVNSGDANEADGEDPALRRREPLFYPQSSQLVPSPDPSIPRQTQRAKTPLFFPLSQLSQADEQAIRDSGLGVEYMDGEELDAMLEGDGEEVEFGVMVKKEEIEVEAGVPGEGGAESLDLFEDEFEPTQDGDGGRKTFQPLFED